MEILKPLYILCGPSGAGKTTLMYAALEQLSFLDRIITYTTRAPRPGEQDGVDYHFVSTKQFAELEKSGAFFEVSRYSGNSYATPRSIMSETTGAGAQKRGFITAVDMNGVEAFLSEHSDVHPLYIHVPLHELEHRLRGRGMQEDLIIQRMEKAHSDTQQAQMLGLLERHVIENKDFDRAREDLIELILKLRAQS